MSKGALKKLSSGWTTWDRLLSKYSLIKNPNILEIGVFRGDATRWFLDNLAGPQSKVVCIDTFQGSPEYPQYNGKQIEAQFRENTKHGPCRVQLMKMDSHSALMKLCMLAKNLESFDVIYVDASHEARDVILDGCLAWKLLRPKGMMIFDDYIWDKIEQEYFRPKMAIDAFLEIMQPELALVHQKRQVFVEKRLRSKYETPRPVASTKR